MISQATDLQDAQDLTLLSSSVWTLSVRC
jgi:hypothetical protein